MEEGCVDGRWPDRRPVRSIDFRHDGGAERFVRFSCVHVLRSKIYILLIFPWRETRCEICFIFFFPFSKSSSRRARNTKKQKNKKNRRTHLKRETGDFLFRSDVQRLNSLIFMYALQLKYVLLSHSRGKTKNKKTMNKRRYSKGFFIIFFFIKITFIPRVKKVLSPFRETHVS